MFDDQAFQSWPLIFTGAAVFALLFGIVALLSELLLDGAVRVSRTVLSLSLAAFVGYVGVAWIIRRHEAP